MKRRGFLIFRTKEITHSLSSSFFFAKFVFLRVASNSGKNLEVKEVFTLFLFLFAGKRKEFPGSITNGQKKKLRKVGHILVLTLIYYKKKFKKKKKQKNKK